MRSGVVIEEEEVRGSGIPHGGGDGAVREGGSG